jgi:hypothetical protein
MKLDAPKVPSSMDSTGTGISFEAEKASSETSVDVRTDSIVKWGSISAVVGATATRPRLLSDHTSTMISPKPLKTNPLIRAIKAHSRAIYKANSVPTGLADLNFHTVRQRPIGYQKVSYPRIWTFDKAAPWADTDAVLAHIYEYKKGKQKTDISLLGNPIKGGLPRFK